MKIFQIILVGFWVLIILPMNSFASDCNVLFLGFPLDTSYGVTGKASSWGDVHTLLVNSKRIPRFTKKDILYFEGLNNGDEFKVRWSNSNFKTYKLACENRKNVYLSLEENRNQIFELDKKIFEEHLSSYKFYKKLSVSKKKYVVEAKGSLSDFIEKVHVANIEEKNPDDGSQLNNLKAEKPNEIKIAINKPPKSASNAKISPPNKSTEKISPKKKKSINRHAVAVVIGNKNYEQKNPDVPDVDYALNDAQRVYEYVVNNLGYREGNVIYLKDATQSEMIRTFGVKGNSNGKLSDWVRSGKSDVFVYYSGHGAPSLSNGQGYLLPVDADPQRVELNGYALETFYENLSQIEAKSMTIVLDACFSGSSQEGTVVKNASAIALRRVNVDQKVPNAAVLTAADASEVASWDSTSKNGLFTRFFLDGVSGAADGADFGNGDGKVTLGELKRYLQDEVTYYARRHYSREQHPQVSGNPAAVVSLLAE